MGTVQRYLGCLVVVAVIGCDWTTQRPIVTGPAPDAGAPELCPVVCSRWKSMGCSEAEAVCDKYAEPAMTCSAWISCESWCKQTEESSVLKLNLQCLSTNAATSCKALEEACSY